MNDLVGSYMRLEKIYRMYIKSAFPLRYNTLSEERDILLRQVGTPGSLSQAPLLETVPIYPSSGRTLSQAADELPAEYNDLRHLAQRLLPPGVPLYEHQWDSIKSAVVDRKDIVVTTGTGSGKTESFLLPLLAQIAYESITWEPVGTPSPDRLWWKEKDERVSQWAHVTRPAALRAIILYPLNALVEDQLRRLRLTLDHEKVHHWLDTYRGGNRITFGRYTGLTPVPGEPTNPNKLTQLRRELKILQHQYDKIQQELLKPDADPDLQWYFANPAGSEMWSRWDMQETPPDILITNYSMLNIMLMRRIENSIFDKTREWLAEPNHPERVFHLIIDELHAYRGTPGTEVAYVIRLLLYRLGLELDSPKLQILTTTASLEDTPTGKEFLRQFFGRDPSHFRVISGTQTQPLSGTHIRLSPYASAFAEFAKKIQPDPCDPMRPVNIKSRAVQQEIELLSNQLGFANETGQSVEQQLGEALKYVKAHDALREACLVADKNRGGIGIVRPAQVPDLDGILFPSTTKSNGMLFSEAMRGFLLALAIAEDPERKQQSPQPVRGHFFFHNLHNLWACSNPNCTDPSCNYRKNADRIPIGVLFGTHRLTCSCGSRVLDLIVCEVCGDVFLGGYKPPDSPPNFSILTPDQPDLENMPDRTSTQRTYADYAIFWPTPHEAYLEPRRPEWSVDKIKRRWQRAKLDPVTGALTIDSKSAKGLEVSGWVYTVDSKSKKIERLSAYPTRCPRCDADYSYRENNPSPLRNHRTGFAKACQVIASGLAREMPVTGQSEKSSRKLVVFSDSRQDAAKLAAGMERDHYRDLVRMALIQSLDEYWDDLVSFLRVMAKTGHIPPSLNALNNTLHDRVTEPPQPDDVWRHNRFRARHDGQLLLEANYWWMDIPILNQNLRDEWLALIQAYPGPVSLLNLRNTVAELLLELGVNFAGASYRVMRYGKSRKAEWYTCYNWNSTPIMSRSPLQPDQKDHLTFMNDRLMSEIMYALFPHTARTLEGLGQGWVSYRLQGNVSDRLKQATDATIRLLGTRRRHKYASFVFPGQDNELPRFVTDYLDQNGISPRDVQQQLIQSGVAEASAQGLVLNPENLYLIRPENGNQGYRCPDCNAFYLHPAAEVCPECIAIKLQQDTRSKDFDYYVYLSEQSGRPFRMSAEELTGQTDKETRSRRQRWFQNIFVDEEIPRVQGVDLLSVTTTMEAGVDIGALLATMMANMPPRRFNYQQRVGRAGRRGAGVSLAVTFCRGRSHDDFYFLRPEKITGDPPPAPYVDMSSQPILKRVLVKEALRQAFSELSITVDIDEKGAPSVHGEFGTATEWTSHEAKISQWMQAVQNKPKLEAILLSLLPQTDMENDPNFRQAMLNFLQKELCQEISQIANDPAYTQEALSERLANAGLLPMFGFPTRVRQLYTRWPASATSWPPETDVVDRNLDVAISQFAPGSQTVKDKAVHTACGVVKLYPTGGIIQSEPGFSPPLTENNPEPLGRCENCRAVRFIDDQPFTPPPSGEEPLTQICPVCGAPEMRIIDAREPKDFFTDLLPEDFEGQFEWTPRSTRPSISFKAQGSNVGVDNVEIGYLFDFITSLNDNNGVGGFDFYDAKVYQKERPGACTVEPENENSPVKIVGQGYRIALLSKRKTDILLVSIKNWPQGIFADPATVEGRAAWYSFAFWLGIAAGVHLDVDPQELQAGFRTILDPAGKPAGEAFLCDELENGAGYCRFLSNPNEFQKLFGYANLSSSVKNIALDWLDPKHTAECDTSCNFCLREYSNLPYHGLLDWRLALDMVSIAYEGKKVDLATPWGKYPNPWQYSLTSSIPKTLERLGYKQPEDFGTLRGYVHTGRAKQVLIEVHPLWQEDHLEYQQAVREVKQRYSGYEVKSVNPFRVLRRPADYISS